MELVLKHVFGKGSNWTGKIFQNKKVNPLSNIKYWQIVNYLIKWFRRERLCSNFNKNLTNKVKKDLENFKQISKNLQTVHSVNTTKSPYKQAYYLSK